MSIVKTPSRLKLLNNVLLAFLFVIVARSSLGVGLVVGIAALAIAASARQAPMHALATEVVGPEIRGEYIAVRNAASQVGIGLEQQIVANVASVHRWARCLAPALKAKLTAEG